jgi:hypothetical protein
MGIGKGGLKPCALAGAARPHEEEALVRSIEYPGKHNRSPCRHFSMKIDDNITKKPELVKPRRRVFATNVFGKCVV